MYLPMWKTDFIQGWIAQNDRFYEDAYLLYICDKYGENVRRGCVVDIGANIGNHTLYFAKEMNVKKIYAFEPIKETYEILCKNIELNKLNGTVRTYNLALGDEHIYGNRCMWSIYTMGSTSIEKSKSSGEFDVCMLDEMNINDDISLIKIDVEGFEKNVIVGAINTIKKYHPIIMIEIFDKSDNFWEIYQLLSEMDYKVESYSDIDYVFY